MIVLSESLIPSLPATVSPNAPLIGWRNLVTTASIAATNAASGYPASHLANPSTALRWRAAGDTPPVSDIHLTIQTGTAEEIDYIAVARHNWGSGQFPISVESDIDGVFVEIVSERIIADDAPLILRFTPQTASQLRVRLQPGTAIPEAAVVYCGLLTKLPRNIYVGHTPLPYGRVSQVLTGFSEGGEFLGRLVVSEMLQTELAQSNVPPDFFRTDIQPFFKAAVEQPFFFAWRPQDYPREVGFVWLTKNGSMSNQLANGFVQIGMSYQGIAA